MKNISIKDLRIYLEALPDELEVRTHLLEDKSFTVIVSPNGDAKTVRNAEGDLRSFLIFLPERAS